MFHPTALPGPFGVGDLGPSAFRFVDQLAAAGQRWWQLLPLGPIGHGNSPYQSYSSFAGNPLLISPEALSERGWLDPSDWADYPRFPEDQVDFDPVIAAKDDLLRRAFQNFREVPADFSAFVSEQASWLDDYVLFMALKKAQGGVAWYDWPPALVRREPAALDAARESLAEEVGYQRFLQYLFHGQWQALRLACRDKGIHILGDLPIFVALDSADVWSRPELFSLDANGRATVVAGVPPDYFAETGQLWGNPLYRWEAHEAEGYAWWASRIRAQTDRVDLVRLDHFRGFEAYWEIPAEAETAVHGRWVTGPGGRFLEAIRKRLGGLPLVAEDLGEITPGVEELRDRFELPGMRVLQFGLSGEPGTDLHLPYRFIPHCIAYTGTHDNDTTEGWFREVPEGSPKRQAEHRSHRAFGRKFLGARGEEVHWEAIQAVTGSVADTAIFPLQDILGLGTEARFNVPGLPRGNWAWRLGAEQFTESAIHRLAELTLVHGRWNGKSP